MDRWDGAIVTDAHLTSGPAAENDQQDALCLRDELMELADEILENELNAPTLPPSASMYRNGTEI